MGFFDGFAEGLADAVDDIRHKVVEEGMYGRETTDDIKLPQVEPAAEVSKWDSFMQDMGEIQPPEPTPDMEMER